MDFYKLIQEQGFNGHTAMDIECILALSSVEKLKEEYLKDSNNAVKAVEDHCSTHNIDADSMNDSLCEVNKYSSFSGI